MTKLCSNTHLGPVVTRRICKDVAMCVETTACDRLIQLFGRLQLGPSIFVPEAETAVRPDSCQCAMSRMKGDAIHLSPTTATTIHLTKWTADFNIRRWDSLTEHNNVLQILSAFNLQSAINTTATNTTFTSRL